MSLKLIECMGRVTFRLSRVEKSVSSRDLTSRRAVSWRVYAPFVNLRDMSEGLGMECLVGIYCDVLECHAVYWDVVECVGKCWHVALNRTSTSASQTFGQTKFATSPNDLDICVQ